MYGLEERNKQVTKLNKSLYGLKDGARTRSELLNRMFKRLGLNNLSSKPCMFVKSNLIVTCHVDDLLFFGKTNDDVRTSQNQLRWVWKIKDLGKPRNFLRIDLTWANNK